MRTRAGRSRVNVACVLVTGMGLSVNDDHRRTLHSVGEVEKGGEGPTWCRVWVLQS
jgi:hypothetical protein